MPNLLKTSALKGIESEVLVILADEVIKNFPSQNVPSTDKGFWSPETNDKLSSKLNRVAIPKKCRLNMLRKERQVSVDIVLALN